MRTNPSALLTLLRCFCPLKTSPAVSAFFYKSVLFLGFIITLLNAKSSWLCSFRRLFLNWRVGEGFFGSASTETKQQVCGAADKPAGQRGGGLGSGCRVSEGSEQGVVETRSGGADEVLMVWMKGGGRRLDGR